MLRVRNKSHGDPSPSQLCVLELEGGGERKLWLGLHGDGQPVGRKKMSRIQGLSSGFMS